MSDWRATISATLLATPPAVLLAVMPGVAHAAKRDLSAHRPNILLILTDDQAPESFAYMPFLQRVKRKAHIFSNYVNTQAMCCPSRASMLTGMYPHNTHVETHVPGDGCYARFKSEGWNANTWAAALQARGYRTTISGKFFNDYRYPSTEVQPGWSDWFVAYDGAHINYRMNDNGRIVSFRHGDRNYKTNVLADRVDRQIRRAHRRDKPFAIVFTPFCPHKPSISSRKYRGWSADMPFPQIASYDEADISDKPSYIQSFPRFSDDRKANIEDRWHKRLDCTRSIDDALKRFWVTLRNSGELGNTYIMVTTDNGMMQGEHRVPYGKNLPYTESYRAPLFVWGPNVDNGNDVRLAANIDLMPTILDMAGRDLSAYPWIDGRSLLPLLHGEAPPWRNSIMLQGYPEDYPALRGVFRSLIGETAVYTQYLGTMAGEFEFYDLSADPLQLDNAYSSLAPAAAQAMQDRLDDLATCAGQDCRDTEDQPL